MAQRLKVFVTTDGLTDYVVAASSRAKALAAGSDYLVIGRPISQALDPAAALAAIVADLV